MELEPPDKVATMEPAARNCTWVTVAPPTVEVEAVRVTLAPTVTTAPEVGAVREIVGAPGATAVTETAVDVVVLPLLSVTRAVREKFAADGGVQVVVYVELPVVPARVAMTVVPERNCTCVTVAPPDPATAVAVSVTLLPEFTTAPGKGAVSEIVGAELPAVTATAAEVTLVPLESSATAVSE